MLACLGAFVQRTDGTEVESASSDRDPTDSLETVLKEIKEELDEADYGFTGESIARITDQYCNMHVCVCV